MITGVARRTPGEEATRAPALAAIGVSAATLADDPFATTHASAPKDWTVALISTENPAARPAISKVMANTRAAPPMAMKNCRFRNSRSLTVMPNTPASPHDPLRAGHVDLRWQSRHTPGCSVDLSARRPPAPSPGAARPGPHPHGSIAGRRRGPHYR